MRHEKDHGSEPANNGDTDNLARPRIPSCVADKTLFHIAPVNPFCVAVGNTNNLAQINFVYLKLVVSDCGDPAMIIPSLAQPDSDISTNSHVLELVSDFHGMRIRD
jgi:hypothetical protein